MSSIFSDFDGKWCVVDAGSVKFIGRAVESAENDFGVIPSLTLQPFFEYICQKVPQQDGNLAKMQLTLPYESITSLDTKIDIINIVSVIWFDNMSAGDLKEYQKQVEKAGDVVEAIRAQRAGIKIERSMPPQKGGRLIV